MLNRKRIFVVGSPRSGTTLLQSMLTVHSNIISFPETHFFYSLFGRHNRYKLYIPFGFNRFTSDYRNYLIAILGSSEKEPIGKL